MATEKTSNLNVERETLEMVRPDEDVFFRILINVIDIQCLTSDLHFLFEVAEG